MLVLSRKANETIQVGDNVTITILKSKGNTVRLGIDAPRDVRVMRGEVLARDESDGKTVIETIKFDRNVDASDDVSGADATGTISDAKVACTTTLAMEGRCEMESFHDASEETRCANDLQSGGRPGNRFDVNDEHEGDCWSVSSMKRRVRKAVASRK